MKLITTQAGTTLWWDGRYWTSESSEAIELNRSEAERALRIINANNRFLDPDDQIEATIVESK